MFFHDRKFLLQLFFLVRTNHFSIILTLIMFELTVFCDSKNEFADFLIENAWLRKAKYREQSLYLFYSVSRSQTVTLKIKLKLKVSV